MYVHKGSQRVPDSLALVVSEPTQIYRYLRTRHRISPIILNRNLTFMRSRLSRGSAARGGFKVDSLLGRKELEVTSSSMSNGFNKGFMTLTFLGYYDKRRERPLERVGCEIFLAKMAHKKRKESSSPMVSFIFMNSHLIVGTGDGSLTFNKREIL